MTDTQEEFDAFIDACARVLDLPIDPAWKQAVGANLSVIFAHAHRLAEFPLPPKVGRALVTTFETVNA